VTNPQGPPNDPSAWGRPGNQGPFGNPHAPTERLRGGKAQGGSPDQGQTVPGQSPGATERLGTARANPQQPGYRPPPTPAGPPRNQVAGPEDQAKPKKKRRLRDPLSIVLVLVIVLAVVVAGVIGAELYVRNQATNKVAEAFACEFQDKATAKFGVAPLVLWQVITKHFTNISVETAGNQIKNAKGAKIDLKIDNVQITNSPDAKGTIGSIDATFTWPAQGIKDSIASKLQGLAKFVTNTVTTHPNDGTVELKGMLDNMVVKPVVSGGGIELQIQTFNALGFSLPKESAQSQLDKYTSDATKNLPLGIHADKVEVTSNSVVAHFITQNATIPTGGKSKDSCFSNL
jgi:LmeA-like phospholipid-binding